jgi:hypothetical protein
MATAMSIPAARESEQPRFPGQTGGKRIKIEDIEETRGDSQ